MPFIKDNDLLEFHKTIDFNKKLAEEWELRFNQKEKEITTVNNKKNWALIALIALGVLCLLLLYTARKKPLWITNNKTLQKSGYQMVSLNEDPDAFPVANNQPVKEDTLSSIKQYNGVIYQVQIAAFKNFSIAMHSDDFNNLSEYSDGYNKYALGKFSSYADATTFKKDLKKLGFKNPFLISFYNNEQIDIRKALVLSNEPQFLDQK